MYAHRLPSPLREPRQGVPFDAIDVPPALQHSSITSSPDALGGSSTSATISPRHRCLAETRLHVEVPAGVEQMQTAVREVVVAVSSAFGGRNQTHLLVQNLDQLQSFADEELSR